MPVEKPRRPLHCSVTVRKASDGEAKRIEASLMELIHQMVRNELDRQRRGLKTVSPIYGVESHGTTTQAQS